MKLPTIPSLIFSFFSFTVSCLCYGQVVFTYGKNAVGREEFLKAYAKNNNEGKPSEKSYRDYLELYIRYKLKVQAAYDMKLDTLSGQQSELKNFRNQVADNYMNDAESLNALVEEAYQRSLKDIHIAHIYIAAPVNASPADTLKAYQKIMEAYDALGKGKDFGAVAAAYSEDPGARNNHGELGWITVFTLPYPLENLAYRTATGQFSKPFRSKGGYHIFKNLGERKALGKMKAAQILLAFPPNADDAVKFAIKQKADSVYRAAAGGANFSELAKRYSGDNLTYQAGGEMPEFGIGKYDPAFEDAAFGLAADGAISRPVPSSFGYHIIKRIYRKEVPEKNKETLAALKQRVLTDPRIAQATQQLLNKIFRETRFRRYPVQENNLFAYTDSVVLQRNIPPLPGISLTTPLFSLGKKEYTVKQWLDYAHGAKANPILSKGKTDKDFFEKFIETSALGYYREHLEEYNKDFAYQLREFREGNMLFEVMQRKIWDKTSTDSAGLKAYYDSHKEKYWWEPSADAVLFTCTREKAATDIQQKLQNHFFSWRSLVDSSGGSVQADSGRFELTQLPMPDKKFAPEQFTSMNTLPPDNTVSFAYIIHVYNEKTPRTFAEARGFVMNDYQNYLEDSWIATLKEKYPVSVNESVLKSLPK